MSPKYNITTNAGFYLGKYDPRLRYASTQERLVSSRSQALLLFSEMMAHELKCFHGRREAQGSQPSVLSYTTNWEQCHCSWSPRVASFWKQGWFPRPSQWLLSGTKENRKFEGKLLIKTTLRIEFLPL